MSAHCEVALCAEFIVQWLARWAGYLETQVRFPVNSPPPFPLLDVEPLLIETTYGQASRCIQLVCALKQHETSPTGLSAARANSHNIIYVFIFFVAEMLPDIK